MSMNTSQHEGVGELELSLTTMRLCVDCRAYYNAAVQKISQNSHKSLVKKRNYLLSKVFRSEKHNVLNDVNQRCSYCDHTCNSLLQLAFDACCLSLREQPISPYLNSVMDPSPMLGFERDSMALSTDKGDSSGHLSGIYYTSSSSTYMTTSSHVTPSHRQSTPALLSKSTTNEAILASAATAGHYVPNSSSYPHNLYFWNESNNPSGGVSKVETSRLKDRSISSRHVHGPHYSNEYGFARKSKYPLHGASRLGETSKERCCALPLTHGSQQSPWTAVGVGSHTPDYQLSTHNRHLPLLTRHHILPSSMTTPADLHSLVNDHTLQSPSSIPRTYRDLLQQHPPPIPPALVRPPAATKLGNLSSPERLVKVFVRGNLNNCLNSNVIKEDEVSPTTPSVNNCFTFDVKRRQVTLPGAPTSTQTQSINNGAGKSKRSASSTCLNFDGVYSDAEPLMEMASHSLVEVLQSVVNGNDACVLSLGSGGGALYGMSSDSTPRVGIFLCALAWIYRLIQEHKEKLGARFSLRMSALTYMSLTPDAGSSDAEDSAVVVDLLKENFEAETSASSSKPYQPQATVVLCEDQQSESVIVENQYEMRVPTVERAVACMETALYNRHRLTTLSPKQKFLPLPLFITLHVYQYRIEKTGTCSGVAGGRSRLHVVDFDSFSHATDNDLIAMQVDLLKNYLLHRGNPKPILRSAGDEDLPLTTSEEELLRQLLRYVFKSSKDWIRTAVLVDVPLISQPTIALLQMLKLASKVHRYHSQLHSNSNKINDGASSCSSFHMRRCNRAAGGHKPPVTETSPSIPTQTDPNQGNLPSQNSTAQDTSGSSGNGVNQSSGSEQSSVCGDTVICVNQPQPSSNTNKNDSFMSPMLMHREVVGSSSSGRSPTTATQNIGPSQGTSIPQSSSQTASQSQSQQSQVQQQQHHRDHSSHKKQSLAQHHTSSSRPHRHHHHHHHRHQTHLAIELLSTQREMWVDGPNAESSVAIRHKSRGTKAAEEENLNKGRTEMDHRLLNDPALQTNPFVQAWVEKHSHTLAKGGHAKEKSAGDGSLLPVSGVDASLLAMKPMQLISHYDDMTLFKEKTRRRKETTLSKDAGKLHTVNRNISPQRYTRVTAENTAVVAQVTPMGYGTVTPAPYFSRVAQWVESVNREQSTRSHSLSPTRQNPLGGVEITPFLAQQKVQQGGNILALKSQKMEKTTAAQTCSSPLRRSSQRDPSGTERVGTAGQLHGRINQKSGLDSYNSNWAAISQRAAAPPADGASASHLPTESPYPTGAFASPLREKKQLLVQQNSSSAMASGVSGKHTLLSQPGLSSNMGSVKKKSKPLRFLTGPLFGSRRSKEKKDAPIEVSVRASKTTDSSTKPRRNVVSTGTNTDPPTCIVSEAQAEMEEKNGRLGLDKQSSALSSGSGTATTSSASGGGLPIISGYMSPYTMITNPKDSRHSSSGRGSDCSSLYGPRTPAGNMHTSGGLLRHYRARYHGTGGHTSSGYESFVRDSEASNPSSHNDSTSESSLAIQQQQQQQQQQTQRTCSAEYSNEQGSISTPNMDIHKPYPLSSVPFEVCDTHSMSCHTPKMDESIPEGDQTNASSSNASTRRDSRSIVHPKATDESSECTQSPSSMRRVSMNASIDCSSEASQSRGKNTDVEDMRQHIRYEKMCDLIAQQELYKMEIQTTLNYLDMDIAAFNLDTSVLETFELDAPGFIEALQQETEHIRQFMDFAKSHVFLTTCFDSLVAIHSTPSSSSSPTALTASTHAAAIVPSSGSDNAEEENHTS